MSDTPSTPKFDTPDPADTASPTSSDDPTSDAPSGDAAAGEAIEGEVLSGGSSKTDEPRAFSTRPGGFDGGSSYSSSGSGGGAGTGGNGFGSSGADSDPSPEDPLGNIWLRALFMVAYGFLGWLVFYFTIFLALLQFIVAVINKELNDDLKTFSARMVLYLKDIISFVTFQTEDKPFPLGKFPSDENPA